MAMVFVNGDITGVEYSANTWGELLEALDGQCAASGEVVTAVRIGRDEIPAFRTAQVVSQPLDANAEVFIDAARPADLILQTLDEADAAAQAIVESAAALGSSYRASDVAAVNRALPAFAENLSMLIVVTSTVAQGARVDLSAIAHAGMSATQMIDSLIAHTEALLSAQQAGHWSRAAEVIDGIAVSLRRWPLVLTAIRETAPALKDVA